MPLFRRLIMNKLKAIWRIIRCDHFYLITSDSKYNCRDMKSTKTDFYTISQFIHLYWNGFYKGEFCSKPGNEKYI